MSEWDKKIGKLIRITKKLIEFALELSTLIAVIKYFIIPLFTDYKIGGKTMAEVKVIIKKEEVEEKEEVLNFIQDLKKNEALKFKGFLEGVKFARKEA